MLRTLRVQNRGDPTDLVPLTSCRLRHRWESERDPRSRSRGSSDFGPTTQPPSLVAVHSVVLMASVPSSADWLVAVATLAYVVLTGGLLFAARKQAQTAELSILTELSARWAAAEQNWIKTLLVSRGPTDYYNRANPEETRRYANLLTEWEALQRRPGTSADRLDFQARHDGRIREYELAATSLIEFLASSSLLVLRGRITVESAYAVFGPQLTRNGGALREVLPHAPRDIQSSGPRAAADEVRWRIRDWGSYRPGVVRRVLALVDLLWAEAVRLDDLGPYELASAAEAKAEGAGVTCRDRVRHEVDRACQPPARTLQRWRLTRLLRRAEWRSFWNRCGLDRGVIEARQTAWLPSASSSRSAAAGHMHR
jgi:hypothetical protein